MFLARCSIWLPTMTLLQPLPAGDEVDVAQLRLTLPSPTLWRQGRDSANQFSVASGSVREGL